jgi:orotidine-5'-phosphate decarboxylase
MTVTDDRAVAIDPTAARDRLALALDVETLTAARSLAHRLAPWFAFVKIGLELFVAEGPAAVEALISDGFGVFLDLKLHDIPTTVERAARRARQIGATYLTVHAAGGEAMLRAGVEGFAEGAKPSSSVSGGGVLGVTVLTSEPDAPEALLCERTSRSARVGCVGVVCAATDLAVVRRTAPDLLAVVPGVRLAGGSVDDQARATTPAAAAAAGAGLLVIGRTVTAAPDPEAAACAVGLEVASV